jgi:hypothetical protein
MEIGENERHSGYTGKLYFVAYVGSITLTLGALDGMSSKDGGGFTWVGKAYIDKLIWVNKVTRRYPAVLALV